MEEKRFVVVLEQENGVPICYVIGNKAQLIFEARSVNDCSDVLAFRFVRAVEEEWVSCISVLVVTFDEHILFPVIWSHLHHVIVFAQLDEL